MIRNMIGVILDFVVHQKNRTPTLETLALLQVCPGAGLKYIGVVPWNVLLKRPLIQEKAPITGLSALRSSM
jgi:hypothetical protein